MARIVLSVVLLTVTVCASLAIWGGLVGYEYEQFRSNPEYRMSREAFVRSVLVTVGVGMLVAISTGAIVLLGDGH